jgi:transcriptional antiterminator RfaH
MGGAEMEERWYAVQTKSRREEDVCLRIQRSSHLPVFLPRLAVRKRRRHHWVTVLEMLFPTYLFVRVPLHSSNWHLLQWTPGVKMILGHGGVPVPVPEEAIRTLMRRAGEGDIIPWSPPVAPGTSVRIGEGPLAGLVGVLERPATRRERVRVLLFFLGREISVEVDIMELEGIS